VSRVFLTGGTGLLGGALLSRLLARGDQVVALARSHAAASALDARGALPVRAELTDEASLATAMRGADLVHHLAGINTLCPTEPARMEAVNGRAPGTVVRAAARAGVPRVVHTSSAATLGEAAGTTGREDSPHRGSFLSTYERTKLEGERAALAAGRETGVEVVSVNPASVQGPGRAGGTARIWLAVLNGRLPVLVPTRVSLVDLADCVEGHVLAAARGRPGERYVLSGATLPVEEALDILLGLAGLQAPPRMAPPWLARGAAAVIEAGARLARRRPPVCREMMRTLLHGHAYDGSRATRELGLTYTPVRETFRRTLAWAVEEGLVTRPLPAFHPNHE
jgi:dihydroflavonol-4-reductase